MDEDFARLLSAFAAKGSLSFADFKAAWTEGRFSELHVVVTTFASLETRDAYQTIYSHLLGYLSQRRPVAWKVGAVFALYTLFCTQPAEVRPEPIRVGPHEWQRLRVLYSACAGAGTAGRDLRAVVARLYYGGALILAAYSGPVGFAAIAQAARLYGLGELTSAADPATTLVDHLRIALGGLSMKSSVPGGGPEPLPGKPKRRRSVAADPAPPTLTELLNADSGAGDAGRRLERDDYATARSRALGAAVHLVSGRVRQASLALNSVLACAATPGGGAAAGAAAGVGGSAAAAAATSATATAAASATGAALLVAAVDGSGAAWQGEDIAGRPDGGARRRLPVTFPGRPSPLFPGVAGFDWLRVGGGGGGGSQQRDLGDAAAADAYERLAAALSAEAGRDARRRSQWDPVSSLASYELAAAWPPPALLVHAYPTLLGGAVTALRIGGDEGGAGMAKPGVDSRRGRASSRGRGRSSHGMQSAGAAAVAAGGAEDSAYESGGPLRDVPYVEVLDLGAGGPACADVDRLRALLRTTLVRGRIIPDDGEGEGHPALGGEAEGPRDEGGDLRARVEAARLRLARASWDNDPAPPPALPSAVVDALNDPEVLGRLLRASFAELRVPGQDERGAYRWTAERQQGPQQQPRSEGGVEEDGAAAGAQRKKKPRGRNAALARLG